MSDNSESPFNHLRDDAAASGSSCDHVDNYPRRQISPPWTPPSRSIATRKVTGRSRGSCRGAFVAPALGREITHESGLEGRTARLLAADPSIAWFSDQPKPVVYVDEAGRERRHTFDFLAERVDGSRVYLFVKPASRIDVRRLELVRRIASQIDRKEAVSVAIVTEREASRTSARDASWFLWAYGDDPEADAVVRNILRSTVGSISIRTLAARSGLGPRGLRAAFRAVRDGEAEQVGAQGLSPAALVRTARRAA